MFNILKTLLIGGVIGIVASKIMKTDSNIIGDIFMGIAGQMFSSWLCAILNVHVYGFTVYIADVIGACIIIWIGNKILTK